MIETCINFFEDKHCHRVKIRMQLEIAEQLIPGTKSMKNGSSSEGKLMNTQGYMIMMLFLFFLRCDEGSLGFVC